MSGGGSSQTASMPPDSVFSCGRFASGFIFLESTGRRRYDSRRRHRVYLPGMRGLWSLYRDYRMSTHARACARKAGFRSGATDRPESFPGFDSEQPSMAAPDMVRKIACASKAPRCFRVCASKAPRCFRVCASKPGTASPFDSALRRTWIHRSRIRFGRASLPRPILAYGCSRHRAESAPALEFRCT